MTLSESPRFMSVSAGGFSATSDAMLYELETNQVWFLSMLGALTSVRAIWAAILKNPPDSLHTLPGNEDEDEERTHRQYFRLMIPTYTIGTWTTKVARLNVSGGWHGMVYTRLAEYSNDFQGRYDFLLTKLRHDQDMEMMHYRFLDKRTELPIHESWAEWLWKRGQSEDEIRELTGHNMEGYYCTFNQEALREDICKAVRRGQLRIEKEDAYALGRTG